MLTLVDDKSLGYALGAADYLTKPVDRQRLVSDLEKYRHVPLLGGIFPVLLLLASRRQGERIPTAVYRFLGNPVLLVSVYFLFLASIFLHGLLIWTNPLERVLAVATSVIVVVMTLAMRKAFLRRTVVELRQEESDEEEQQGFFSVTIAGRAGKADVRLEYAGTEKRYEATSGEVPDFSLVRRAIFEPQGGAGVLKVWAHKITPEGDSVALSGLLNVRQGDETRQFDLRLSDGQVVLPMAQGPYGVDITLAEADDVSPMDRLS